MVLRILSCIKKVADKNAWLIAAGIFDNTDFCASFLIVVHYNVISIETFIYTRKERMRTSN